MRSFFGAVLLAGTGGAFASTADVEVSKVTAALSADDECLQYDDGSGECTLSALQLRGTKAALAEERPVCSGDELPSSLPVCFFIPLPVFTLEAKLTSYADGKGSMDMSFNGGELGKVEFEQDGQAFSVVSQTLAPALQMKTMLYCSDQKELFVSLKKQATLTMQQKPCSTSLLSLSTLSTKRDAMSYSAAEWAVSMAIHETVKSQKPASKEIGIINPTTACTGSGSFSSVPACYEGSLLMFKLVVKVTEFAGGKGKVDMSLAGPVTGEVKDRDFSKEGQELLVDGADEINERITVDTVEYCSGEDEIRVKLSKPLPVTVGMTAVQCSA